MKKLFSTLFLLCMFAAILFGLYKVTLNQTDEGCIQLADFYKLEENTVDVLFVGSSHVYYSVNTCQLYDDYGIASYLLASPGQPIWISYYFLEEALKTQSPELVVFDVCTLYRKESEIGTASLPSLISMKPSARKWKAIRAVNAQGQLLDSVGAFFAFPYYHTRYVQSKKQEQRYHGYKPEFHVISKSELEKWQNPDRSDFDQLAPVSEQTENYLRKMIKLCKENGIRMLLVNSPYLNQTKEKQMAYNYVFQIAREYGVPYIDSNRVKEMQIDFAADLFEPSHLNYYGALKYTKYLAEWFEKHYEIPDRRNDDRYENWEEASKQLEHSQLYRRTLKKLKKKASMADYVQAVRQLEECIMVVYQKPAGMLYVFDHNQLVFSNNSEKAYFKHWHLGKSDLAVTCGKGQLTVMVDRKEYLDTEQGINILVYDKVAQDVIDVAGFDKTEFDAAGIDKTEFDAAGFVKKSLD